MVFNMIEDLILIRMQEGNCPICNEPNSNEVRCLKYKDHSVLICAKHYVQGQEYSA